MMLREQDARMVAEIMRLHDEAFEYYQQCSGSMWKSSEGAVSIHFGNYWARQEGAAPSVEVYSYALGPNRTHHFPNIPAALNEVRQWHRDAFAHTCGEDC